MPGLRVNADGNVEGDELTLTNPDTLTDLANWCRQWDGRLKGGRVAEIELRDDVSLELWADAFDDMAELLR